VTVSDAVLTKLRAQVVIQAAHEDGPIEWRELAEALAELENWRQFGCALVASNQPESGTGGR